MQNITYQVKPEHIDLLITGVLLIAALTAFYFIAKRIAQYPVFILLSGIGSISLGITTLAIPALPIETLNGVYISLVGLFLMLASAFAYRSAK